MNYKELQEKAKGLGLKHVGVSREDLEKQIAEAEGKEGSNNNSEVTPDTAIIYDGKFEVRRYTLHHHGEDFEKIAKDFAKRNNFTVFMENVGDGINCPACGHRFYQA